MAMICDNCVVGHLYSRVLALSLERQWQCWLSTASGFNIELRRVIKVLHRISRMVQFASFTTHCARTVQFASFTAHCASFTALFPILYLQ